MNEELIKRCAEEAGMGDGAANAIRLYHARAVEPLEQENANLRGLVERLLPCAEYLHEEDENLGGLIEEVKTALAPFQKENSND